MTPIVASSALRFVVTADLIAAPLAAIPTAPATLQRLFSGSNKGTQILAMR